MIFVVTIPLLSVVVFGVMVVTRRCIRPCRSRLDRVLGLTRENLTGVRVVRAFDKEQSEIDRFEDANDLLTRMQLHVGHPFGADESADLCAHQHCHRGAAVCGQHRDQRGRLWPPVM